mmetsp:Transcript_44307/g.106733  ORF Transcript_44307/g.106733 Transcript_44307/m.106733 type:complete len:399 (+) Transcript_44307:458-1654(+)
MTSNHHFNTQKMNRLTTFIGILLLASGSVAQEPIVVKEAPTGAPSENPSNEPSSQELPAKPAPTLAPTRRPSSDSESTTPTPWDTSISTPLATCTGNNDEWRYTISSWSNGRWLRQNIGCDDSRVQCWYFGNYGQAKHQCCKCKLECEGQCKDQFFTPATPENSNFVDSDKYILDYDDESGYEIGPLLLIIAFGLCCFFACVANIPHNRDLQATRQTMTERRQQLQEGSSGEGLSEEERNHARYKLFVTKFYFQTVLPDKSNITADSLRKISIHRDEECPTDRNRDEECATEESSSKTESDGNDDDGDDDDSALGIEKETGFSEQTMSERLERLSIWRKASAKNECCICLECYAVGETVCAPIKTSCHHVFHEGCINEWFKKSDKCPLCRVDLLTDSK